MSRALHQCFLITHLVIGNVTAGGAPKLDPLDRADARCLAPITQFIVNANSPADTPLAKWIPLVISAITLPLAAFWLKNLNPVLRKVNWSIVKVEDLVWGWTDYLIYLLNNHGLDFFLPIATIGMIYLYIQTATFLKNVLPKNENTAAGMALLVGTAAVFLNQFVVTHLSSGLAFFLESLNTPGIFLSHLIYLKVSLLSLGFLLLNHFPRPKFLNYVRASFLVTLIWELVLLVFDQMPELKQSFGGGHIAAYGIPLLVSISMVVSSFTLIKIPLTRLFQWENYIPVIAFYTIWFEVFEGTFLRNHDRGGTYDSWDVMTIILGFTVARAIYDPEALNALRSSLKKLTSMVHLEMTKRLSNWSKKRSRNYQLKPDIHPELENLPPTSPPSKAGLQPRRNPGAISA